MIRIKMSRNGGIQQDKISLEYFDAVSPHDLNYSLLLFAGIKCA